MTFLLMYWKQLLLSVLIAGGSYFIYDKIDTVGYNRAKAEDALVIKKYEDEVATKIAAIEVTSTTLANESRDSAIILNSNILKIVSSTKGKSLVIVKDSGCTPSQTFSDSFNLMNKRVNQNIKGNKQ